MSYTREELDWIENEWARNLHGRPTFISREDYHQLQAWSDAGVPASDVVDAITTYFQRRLQNSKGRSFVALSYLTNDVAKAVKLSSSINLNEILQENTLWNTVKEPVRSDSRCRFLFKIWRQTYIKVPSEDAPMFLDYFDAERKAFKELVACVEVHLGDRVELLKRELRIKMIEAEFVEGTINWHRAWEHNWMRVVCDFFGIPWKI
jgi:hypothetical protein